MREETISTVMIAIAVAQFFVLVGSTYLIRRDIKRSRQKTLEYNARYEELVSSIERLRMETEESYISYQQAVHDYDMAIKELSERESNRTLKS